MWRLAQKHDASLWPAINFNPTKTTFPWDTFHLTSSERKASRPTGRRCKKNNVELSETNCQPGRIPQPSGQIGALYAGEPTAFSVRIAAEAVELQGAGQNRKRVKVA
eukprot:scaffold155781_cov30-Prasinocladus_malaysianus.AAC.1